MANRYDRNNFGDEIIEDTTLYGEFVSSFHGWITSDRQRMMARYLEEVTSEIAPDPEEENHRKYSR
jgi:hypothetical protein